MAKNTGIERSMKQEKSHRLRRESSIVTTKTEQNNDKAMFNTGNEGTGGLRISYFSRKIRGKVLNFI
jgi:hypothetical protein